MLLQGVMMHFDTFHVNIYQLAWAMFSLEVTRKFTQNLTTDPLDSNLHCQLFFSSFFSLTSDLDSLQNSILAILMHSRDYWLLIFNISYLKTFLCVWQVLFQPLNHAEIIQNLSFSNHDRRNCEKISFYELFSKFFEKLVREMSKMESCKCGMTVGRRRIPGDVNKNFQLLLLIRCDGIL